MAKILPFKDFASFTEEITLESIPYIFIFNWNSRGEFWEMSIQDRENNFFIAGVKLVVNFEIISDYPDKGLPPGQLWVIDESGSNTPIQYEDFYGDRPLKLVYLTESEI